MEAKIIDRIFTELDNHTNRLVAMSEVVHANAAILGLVSKLVVGIIMFIIITSLGTLYSHFKQKQQPIYNRQIAPVETQMDNMNKKANNNKGGLM